MVEQAASEKPHSADYLLTDWRDFWWNDDFIALMATRWQLEKAKSVLDVGCGRGHWLAKIFPHLNENARGYGCDREEKWVADASESFARRYPGIR